jgi:hypothetical protein
MFRIIELRGGPSLTQTPIVYATIYAFVLIVSRASFLHLERSLQSYILRRVGRSAGNVAQRASRTAPEGEQ